MKILNSLDKKGCSKELKISQKKKKLNIQMIKNGESNKDYH